MPIKETAYKSVFSTSVGEFLNKKKVEKGSSPDDVEFLSILDFIEKFKLLPFGLYPVQRFIVKMYYNIPLDDKDKTIEVRDMFGVKVLHRFTEVEYLKYLYDKGHCNIREQDGKERRELILVLGRRSGKCSNLNTRVFTTDGIFSLGELVRSKNVGWQDLDVTVCKENGIRTGTDGVYFGGKQKTRKLTTYCGYKQESTPEHRVKVLSDDGHIIWKYFSEIKEGDFIGINRSSNIWASKYVDISEHSFSSIRNTAERQVLIFLKDKGPNDRASIQSVFSAMGPQVVNLHLRNLVKTGYVTWQDGLFKFKSDTSARLPQVVDESFGEFLGMLVGDGTWRTDHGLQNRVEITGGCEQLRAHVEGTFSRFLGGYKLQRRVSTHNTCEVSAWQVRKYDKPFRTLLDKLGYGLHTQKDQKSVPWVIFKSPKPVVSAFLRGLFETDGGLEKDGVAITFSSHSRQLVDDMQFLLGNYGIICKVASKYNKRFNSTNWTLRLLGGESRKIFAKEIGFITKRKNDLMWLGLAHASKGCSDTESVPNLSSQLRALRDSLSVKLSTDTYRHGPKSGFKNLLGGSLRGVENCSYERLQKAIDFARARGGDDKITANLQSIVDLNYFWDPVVSVEESECEVADISVPDGHEYVANNFTNHNSALSSVFASYELYKLLRRGHPQHYYGMPDGSEIRVLCVANDKEQAGIVYGDMQAHVEAVDYFKSAMANTTQTFMKFRTEHDKEKFGLAGKATISATFKSSVAKGLRGRGVMCAILDEIAFFVDDGQTSGEKVYKALMPALAQFSPKDPQNKHVSTGPTEGRMILISSPDAKEGFFYRMYQMAMSNDKGASDMLLIQAPTWEVNPTLDRSYYEKEYFKDPRTFMTEHGAQFSDRVRGWIEDVNDLNSCIDFNAVPRLRGAVKEPHFCGVDVGLVNDGTAVSLTRVNNGKIELVYHEIWYAKKRWAEANPHLKEPLTQYARTLQDVARLDMHEVALWLKELSKRFYIHKGIFDQWSGIVFEQELHKQGLTQFEIRNFFASESSQMYQTFKMFMYANQLSLYDFPKPEMADGIPMGRRSPLIMELLELQASTNGKNIITVEAPNVPGKHDDMSDSLARSILLATEYVQLNPSAFDKKVIVQSPMSPSLGRTPTYQAYHRERRKLMGGSGGRRVATRTPPRLPR